METKTQINAGEAKYWMEKAEEIADNHQTVFRLKEYLLKMENGSGDQTQLAQLIESNIQCTVTYITFALMSLYQRSTTGLILSVLAGDKRFG